MSGEDQTLPVKLERLEIESGKTNINTSHSDQNPFQRKSGSNVRNNNSIWGNRCNCTPGKRVSRNKSGTRSEDLANTVSSVSLSPGGRSNPGKIREGHHDTDQTETLAQPDFRSLVSSCSQLRISNDLNNYSSDSFQNAQIRDNDRVSGTQYSASGGDRQNGLIACSQQALNPPCDVTIDELASYFETLVHIPKKMSTMAEMMYI